MNESRVVTSTAQGPNSVSNHLHNLFKSDSIKDLLLWLALDIVIRETSSPSIENGFFSIGYFDGIRIGDFLGTLHQQRSQTWCSSGIQRVISWNLKKNSFPQISNV